MVAVTIPRPRSLAVRELLALKASILRELGVDERADERLVTRCRALVALALAAACLAAGAPLLAAPGARAELRGGALRSAAAGARVHAALDQRHRVRLSRQMGKVVVLTFGYTSSPDICPTVLAELAQVRQRLGAAAKRVQVVYVERRSERDSSARLRAYTEQFDRTFIGLTGADGQARPRLEGVRRVVVRRELPGPSRRFI